MGPIAAITFVAMLTGTFAPGAAPGRSAPHAAPVALVAGAATSRDHVARTVATPVVAYAGVWSAPLAASGADDETAGAFGDVATYAAFAPERAALPTRTNRATLLARLRRAASRILAVAERMPHF